MEQVGAVYTTVRTATATTKIPNIELAHQSVQVTGGSAPASTTSTTLKARASLPRLMAFSFKRERA